MEVLAGPRAADRQELLRAVADGAYRRAHIGVIIAQGRGFRRRQIIAHRERHDEVAIREPLHQRARSQPIRAMIREVRLTRHVQAGDGAHQVVVHPEAAHGVVHGGIDAHRHFVWILVRDALVHLEQVAVPLVDGASAEALDGVTEVEVHAVSAGTNAATLVADLLRGARCDVAR